MASSRSEDLSAKASAWEENLHAAHRAMLQKGLQRRRSSRLRSNQAVFDEETLDQTEEDEPASSRDLGKWLDVFGVVMLLALVAFTYYLVSNSSGDPATWLMEQYNGFTEEPLTLPDVREGAGDAIDWLLRQLPIWWDQLLSSIEEMARWVVDS